MKKMKKTIKILGLLLVVFSLTVPVFAGGQEVSATAGKWSLEEASKPYAGTTITTILEPWAAGEAWVPIIKDFTKITGIKVEYEWLDFPEAVAAVNTDFMAKTHIYDFIGTAWNDVGKWAELGVIEPIEKYLSDKKLKNPDMEPTKNVNLMFIKSLTWNGKLYGLLMFPATSFGIYRKDIADSPQEQANFQKKYGYKMEFPPKTPQMYYDICEFFTRKKGEKLCGEVLKNDFYGTTLALKRHYATTANFEKFLVPFGGWWFDDEGNITIDTPEALKTLEFMMSLRDFCPSGYIEATWDEQVNQYILGNVFMYDSWIDTFPYIEDPDASRVAGKNGYFAPEPWKKGAYKTIGNYKGISILSGSRNKEATYLFLQYIQRPKVQKKYHLNGGTTFNNIVLADPEIKAVTPYADTLLEILSDPSAMLPLKGFAYGTQIFDVAANEINKVAANKISAKEALTSLQAKAEKIARGE